MRPVFFDVDTQLDFLYPAGALYVPGAERIVGALARLNQWAAARGFPVVSTTDAHRENDPEFADWPAHCVAGTLGQRKPASLLLDKRVVIPSTACDLNIDGAAQIILEKQRLDCFSNPNLPALLERLGADRYVVYGVVTEICVKFAAWGLLATGKPVSIVTDAVRSLTDEASAAMLAEFAARGGRLVRVSDVASL